MTEWKHEWKKLLWIVAVFLLFFWLPVGWERLGGGIMEALSPGYGTIASGGASSTWA